MFINPEIAIKEKWIVQAEGCPPLELDHKKPGYQIQQNGIDIRVNIIKQVGSGGVVGKDFKTNPEYLDVPIHQDVMVNKELVPLPNSYDLHAFSVYVFDAMEYIKVPNNIVVLPLIQRSSFNRRGTIIESGVWDSGFEGTIGGSIRPMSNIVIQKGTRICQVLFAEADAFRTYEGEYQYQRVLVDMEEVNSQRT